jgi:hypothetical protein
VVYDTWKVTRARSRILFLSCPHVSGGLYSPLPPTAMPMRFDRQPDMKADRKQYIQSPPPLSLSLLLSIFLGCYHYFSLSPFYNHLFLPFRQNARTNDACNPERETKRERERKRDRTNLAYHFVSVSFFLSNRRRAKSQSSCVFSNGKTFHMICNKVTLIQIEILSV